MKKIFVLGAAVFAVFAMTSCKSKESAYRKAYEKAQAQQQTVTPTTSNVVTTPTTPTTVTPVTPTTPTTQTTSNVSVRNEAVQLVAGPALKAYSVVVGAFKLQSGAKTVYDLLASKGYTPRIVSAQTAKGNLFRVVATSYDSKEEAAQSRNALDGQYPGSWLLYQK